MQVWRAKRENDGNELQRRGLAMNQGHSISLLFAPVLSSQVNSYVLGLNQPLSTLYLDRRIGSDQRALHRNGILEGKEGSRLHMQLDRLLNLAPNDVDDSENDDRDKINLKHNLSASSLGGERSKDYTGNAQRRQETKRRKC